MCAYVYVYVYMISYYVLYIYIYTHTHTCMCIYVYIWEVGMYDEKTAAAMEVLGRAEVSRASVTAALHVWCTLGFWPDVHFSRAWHPIAVSHMLSERPSCFSKLKPQLLRFVGLNDNIRGRTTSYVMNKLNTSCQLISISKQIMNYDDNTHRNVYIVLVLLTTQHIARIPR